MAVAVSVAVSVVAVAHAQAVRCVITVRVRYDLPRTVNAWRRLYLTRTPRPVSTARFRTQVDRHPQQYGHGEDHRQPAHSSLVSVCVRPFTFRLRYACSHALDVRPNTCAVRLNVAPPLRSSTSLSICSSLHGLPVCGRFICLRVRFVCDCITGTATTGAGRTTAVCTHWHNSTSTCIAN